MREEEAAASSRLLRDWLLPLCCPGVPSSLLHAAPAADVEDRARDGAAGVPVARVTWAREGVAPLRPRAAALNEGTESGEGGRGALRLGMGDHSTITRSAHREHRVGRS